MGQFASEFSFISFAELFVPDDIILGEVGQGYRIAISNLEAGRIGIVAQCICVTEAVLETAIDSARERRS